MKLNVKVNSIKLKLNVFVLNNEDKGKCTGDAHRHSQTTNNNLRQKSFIYTFRKQLITENFEIYYNNA